MNETQIWTRKLEDVIQMIRKLNPYKGDKSINGLWVKSLKSDAKEIIGNLKKLAKKDPSAAQAVKRFTQELRAFDANTTHDDRKSDIAKLLRNAATILNQLSVHSQSKRSTPKDVRSSALVVKKLLASARIASGGQYANELRQLEGHVDKIAQWPENSQAGKIAAQLAARIASISGHMTDPWAGDAASATQNGGIRMNTIRQKMNYHAREYRRLKAMDAGGEEMDKYNRADRIGSELIKKLRGYYSIASSTEYGLVKEIERLKQLAQSASDPQVKNLAKKRHYALSKELEAVKRIEL